MKKKNFWALILVGCTFLSANQDPSCAALKKIAGNAKAIYIGHTKDIATLTYATDGDVATFTMTASTYLYKYTSKNQKIGCTYNLVAGANTNLFAQEIKIPLYHATQSEQARIQELAKAEDLFIIVHELSGVLKCYGLNNVSNIGDFYSYGLKATAGEGGTGVELQDDTAYTITLGGNVPNMPMIYKPGTAIATNIAALDAMVIA